MLCRGSPLTELVLLKYPQHILLTWWIKVVPPSRCYTLWCKVLQPLAGWFLSLCDLWIERKLDNFKNFFSTQNQGLCLSFLFSGCWNVAVSLPKLDTTSHLLFWMSLVKALTMGWWASSYLDNSLSWNWGPFLKKYTHRVSKNYSGIKCQQRRLIWNSNCWIICSAMSR